MNTKTTVIISAVSLAVAFAGGRYSVQAPSSKTKEVVQVDTTKDIAKNTKKKTTIEKNPDGSTKTTIDEETTTDTSSVTNSLTKVSQSVTAVRTGTLNISALGGMDFSSSIPKPIYGASVTKEIVGPVTLGAFGLMNGVVGLSVGVNF